MGTLRFSEKAIQKQLRSAPTEVPRTVKAMATITVMSIITASAIASPLNTATPGLIAPITTAAGAITTAEPELRKRAIPAVVDVYMLDYALYADYPVTSPYHFAYANGEQWTCKSRPFESHTFAIVESFVGCGEELLTSCYEGAVSDVAVGPWTTETCDRYLSCVTIPLFEKSGDTSAPLSYVKCGSYGEGWYRTSTVKDAPTRHVSSSTVSSTTSGASSTRLSVSRNLNGFSRFMAAYFGYFGVVVLVALFTR